MCSKQIKMLILGRNYNLMVIINLQLNVQCAFTHTVFSAPENISGYFQNLNGELWY